MRNIGYAVTTSALALASVSAAMAQQAPDAEQASSAGAQGIQDIIVTAQKRRETANRVGMSITAISSDTLVRQNIQSPSDLQKVISGFTLTDAPRGAPVFAIRGIGFDDSTVGSASTVALYSDEVPIPFPMEARFPTLDLERMEVLKGPQGILFGQNSTAGAINFIAAKPTQDFHAGVDASYGRFDQAQISGFISGGITDTLRVRISAMGVRSSGWQYDYERPNDSLGAKRSFAGRMIAEWTPTDRLKLTLNVNGWIDKSDTQAAQLLNAFPIQAQTPFVPYDLAPLPPQNARAAGWDAVPKTPLRRNDNFLQISGRIDYKLTDEITFTSLTSFSRYNQDYGLDVDGTGFSNFTIGDIAAARSFSQEVRALADFDRVKLTVGGNYSRDITREDNRFYVDESSINLGFFNNRTSGAFLRQPVRDIAVFGNADVKPVEAITLHAGVRYTRDRRSYTGCTRDIGDGSLAGPYNTVLPLINPPGAPAPNIPLGGCASVNSAFDPALVTAANPTGQYFAPGVAQFELRESNVSWRFGVDYQVNAQTLLYANVSKGYKSGGFPAVNVATNFQLAPVTQESVLAYEAGIKVGLFDRRLQINLAGFYDDYSNKQLRGRLLDPLGFFGVLDKLLNIPKSRVQGIDASVQAVPMRGLNLNLAAAYTDTKVTRDFFAYDPVGNEINYKGLAFPHTPKWNVNASVDYETAVSKDLSFFIGANILYQSATTGLFARPSEISTALLDPTLKPGVTVPGDTFNIKAYSTVDGQIGVKSQDGDWRAWIWGKNIFNTYYWNNVTQSLDSLYRLTGMPATYGVSVSFRY